MTIRDKVILITPLLINILTKHCHHHVSKPYDLWQTKCKSPCCNDNRYNCQMSIKSLWQPSTSSWSSSLLLHAPAESFVSSSQNVDKICSQTLSWTYYNTNSSSSETYNFNQEGMFSQSESVIVSNSQLNHYRTTINFIMIIITPGGNPWSVSVSSQNVCKLW